MFDPPDKSPKNICYLVLSIINTFKKKNLINKNIFCFQRNWKNKSSIGNVNIKLILRKLTKN